MKVSVDAAPFAFKDKVEIHEATADTVPGPMNTRPDWGKPLASRTVKQDGTFEVKLDPGTYLMVHRATGRTQTFAIGS